MRNGGERRRRSFASVLGAAALLLLWWVAAQSDLIGRTLVASPAEVVERILASFSPEATPYERLHAHALATLGRAVEGWIIGMGLGALLGLALGRSRFAFDFTAPSVEFIRAIPPILAFPLLLVAFNYSRESYVGTIVFGCVPVVAITVAQGIKTIAQERMEIFRLHQRRKSTQLLVSIMEIMPALSLAARLTFSFSLIIAVVTEMVFTPRSGFGIGSIAREAEVAFDTPSFYGSVLLIGIIGYLGNQLLRALEYRLSPTTLERP